MADSSGRNENTRKGGVWVEPCISSTADAFSHAPPEGTNDTVRRDSLRARRGEVISIEERPADGGETVFHMTRVYGYAARSGRWRKGEGLWHSDRTTFPRCTENPHSPILTVSSMKPLGSAGGRVIEDKKGRT